MFFPKCAPNGILGVEDTLTYVAQNVQWLAHIPPQGFPWSVLWLLPSVHKLFEDCSHTYYPWDTPTDKNMGGGFKSCDCAAHSISHFLLISLSLNRSLSQARESFVVWGVAPILPEPLFISIYTSASSQWCSNDAQNIISTAT
jgi:hypothetical protein